MGTERSNADPGSRHNHYSEFSNFYVYPNPAADNHFHSYSDSASNGNLHFHPYNIAGANKDFHARACYHFNRFDHTLPMKSNWKINIIAVILLAGCGTPASAAQPPLPFALVTSAPNPSPTPTPFQPLPIDATAYFISASDPLLLQPTIDPALFTPTAIPPTPTQVPTIDPNLLVNTVAPQPTIDSQVLNNGKDTVNFLLIGSDRRPTGSFRTDTLVVAILRPSEGQVSLISIPRDLWVSIPGFENNRINTAYQLGISADYPGGGPGLLRDTIQYNLGIRIDHTSLVEFDGFRKIVDTLGGVDVPVSCPYTDWRLIDPGLDPENENNWYLFTANPGVIHMDGDLSLWYARSRQKSNDFDRGRRQQEVLRALFSQALQTGTLTRIPELYGDLKDTVETDLGLGDILKLSLVGPKLTNANIRSYYIRPPLVSSWITDGGAYVLLPNTEPLQQMLTEALSPSTKTVEKQAITIDVMNGTSIPGYETLAATRLNYAGYETHIIASDRQDYANSVLIDKTPVQDRNIGTPILSVLGLLPSNLIPSPSSGGSDYLLILGYDYQPCFRPENLGQ